MAPDDRGRLQRPFQIFISYRRGDSGPYARNLYDGLTQQFGEGSVFYDIDSIAPGRDFVEVLDDTLRRADVLLVVIGPSWLDVVDAQGARRLDDADDYVRLEVETALARRDLRVIPVLVGGAEMPAVDSVPEPLAPLCRRNAMSLIDDHWRSTMGELVDVLERVRSDLTAPAPADDSPTAVVEGAPVGPVAAATGTEPPPPSPVTTASAPAPSPPPTSSARSKRRLLVPVSIVVIVVLAGIVAVVALQGSGNGSKPRASGSTPPSSAGSGSPRGWSAAAKIDGNPLDAVSCAKPTFCAAVDDKGYALTYDGHAWSRPRQIDDTTGNGAPMLTEVSCAGDRSVLCVALDPFSSSAFTYDGRGWSAPTSLRAEDVSCPSNVFCMAVLGNSVSVYKNGAWSPVADVPGITNLGRVSCATPDFCLAAGSGASFTGYSSTYYGDVWTDPTKIDTPAAGGITLNQVSCANRTFCVAADESGLAFVYTGVSWSSESLAYVNPHEGGTLWAVSCPTQTFCVSGADNGRVFTFDGSTWSGTTIAGDNSNISGVSCRDQNVCVAVDNHGNAYTYRPSP